MDSFDQGGLSHRTLVDDTELNAISSDARDLSKQRDLPMTEAKSIAMEYYRRLDAGDPTLMDLFSDDAEFYFPRFGVSMGKSSFQDLLSGLLARIEAISHDQANLLFIAEGDKVAVEGKTKGKMKDGQSWNGGSTVGGRFSSIFEVTDGLISRMYVYLDPDYTTERPTPFPWPNPQTRRS